MRKLFNILFYSLILISMIVYGIHLLLPESCRWLNESQTTTLNFTIPTLALLVFLFNCLEL